MTWGQTLGREGLPRLCSFLLALWQRRVFSYFWKMNTKRCEFNGCERQREVLTVKALNVAPEAQVVLARGEVWSRSLQSGGMKGPGGKYTMGSLWKPSRLFNLPVTLPAKTGQTNPALPFLGFIQTFPVTLQKMCILVCRATLKCVCWLCSAVSFWICYNVPNTLLSVKTQVLWPQLGLPSLPFLGDLTPEGLLICQSWTLSLCRHNDWSGTDTFDPGLVSRRIDLYGHRVNTAISQEWTHGPALSRHRTSGHGDWFMMITWSKQRQGEFVWGDEQRALLSAGALPGCRR